MNSSWLPRQPPPANLRVYPKVAVKYSDAGAFFKVSVTEKKGLNYLSELVCTSDWHIENLFTLTNGKLAPDFESEIGKLQNNGVYVENRYITDDEIGSHPSYDQASGVFGRSVQINRIPIVRSGSVVAKIAKILNTEVITLNYGDVNHAINLISGNHINAKIVGYETLPFTTYRQDFCKSIEEAL